MKLYSASLGKHIPVAVVAFKLREATHVQQLVQIYIDMSLTAFKPYHTKSQPVATTQGEIQRHPCVGCDSGVFASAETNFLCSVCYEKQMIVNAFGFHHANRAHDLKCRSQGCSKQGLTSKDDYCLECFLYM